MKEFTRSTCRKEPRNHIQGIDMHNQLSQLC